MNTSRDYLLSVVHVFLSFSSCPHTSTPGSAPSPARRPRYPLCAPPVGPRRKNAERSTAWTTGTSGAPSADGRRPAPGSATEVMMKHHQHVNSTRRCYIVNHAYTVSCGEDDENKRGISAKISHWRRKWGTRCLRIHLGAVSGDLFKKRFVYLKRNLSRIFFLLQRYPAYSPPAHQAKGRGKYKIKKVYNPGYQKCPVFTILNLFDKNVRLSLMGLPTFWRFDFGECFFVNKSWPEDGEQEFERHVFFFKLYIYHLSFSTVPCDGQFEFGRLMKMKTLNQTPRDACKMLLEPFLALRANLPEG